MAKAVYGKYPYPVIKHFMKQRGFTQEKLADKIGISRPALAYKLEGKREFFLWEAIAMRKAFSLSESVDLAWLFTKKEIA